MSEPISDRQIGDIFKAALEVRYGYMSRHRALKTLNQRSGLSMDSARPLLANLLDMFDGVPFIDAQGPRVTRLFLQYIEAEYGPEGLRRALYATRVHTDRLAQDMIRARMRLLCLEFARELTRRAPEVLNRSLGPPYPYQTCYGDLHEPHRNPGPLCRAARGQ